MTPVSVRRMPRGPDDDSGSMALAMLLIMVAVTLTALLAPMAVVQVRTSHSTLRRNLAGYAAQAGLEAVLAQIRAADDGSGKGVLTGLPCGPVSGKVGGGTAARYEASVFYTAFDPQAQMTAGPSWFAANDIDCVAGAGPATIPRYAVTYATGSVSGTSRTLRSAYRLRTTNQNIAGGRIHVMNTAASTIDLCMDTGTTVTPAAGTTLRAVGCDPSRKQQIFAYTQQSRLQLVNSVTAAQPAGMCLDAGNPQVEGALVTFRPCASPVPTSQQWQLQGGGQFANVDGAGNPNGFVMELLSPNFSGSTIKITKSPSAGGFNHFNSFSAEATVGPGNAGPHNKQLVNYRQFGRCLDLTGGNYQAGYLIVWPCKPSWNQSFTVPTLATSMSSAVPGKITLTVLESWHSTPPGLYCLRSPRSTAPQQYAVLVACTSNDTAVNLQWRAYGYTGVYATSYRIVDVDGNCLQPTDNEVPSPDIWEWGDKISKVVMQPCSDSTLQKWNADPDVLAGLDLKYIGE